MKSGKQPKYVSKKDIAARCAESGGSVAVATLMHRVILKVKRLAKRRLREVRKPYDPAEHAKHKDRDNARTKKWADNNKDKIAQKQKIYKKRLGPILAARERLKYHSDPLFRLKCRVRARLRHFLRAKSFKKDTSTFKLVGCSPEDLRRRLQQQLPEGAFLEDYEVDHIFPLNIYLESEMYKMTHFSNLQPLKKGCQQLKTFTIANEDGRVKG